jgi:cytochrome c oxidase subunit I
MSDIPLIPEPTKPLPRVSSREGLLHWVATIDHKLLGIMYMMVAIFFLVVGGIEAMLIRTQLIVANNNFLSPQAYNQIFTMHGTTMIFLAVMPFGIGAGIYLLPLQIGARDMALPRLNALSFWLLVFGGLLMYFSFIAGGAPDVGWFAYAPLTEKPFSTGPGVDYWAIGLLVMGIGSLAGGINFVVTALTMRAPGMKLTQLPLFSWIIFINGFLLIVALPPLNGALVMLEADRILGAHFFRPAAGGDAILWQHYFWAFGHPEVYILILPAFGMVSEIIPVFSRKPLFGAAFVAGSTVGIFFLSIIVYGHHMFTVDLGPAWNFFFALASAAIAVPTGVKIFNWSLTMWGGKIQFSTAMLFCIFFLISFTSGGITGVSFTIVPVDWQVNNSYYVVAHLHYVAVGGVYLGFMAAIYYWFPKVTGRMLSERLGKWHFWLSVVGINMTFLIQHVLGVAGMPRRVYTYPDFSGWTAMNIISSIGGYITAISVLVLVWNILTALIKGPKAGDNPWDAWTLEWATTSPPPIHNFEQLPPIRGRRPLWDLKHPDDQDWMRKETGQKRTSEV